MEQQQEITVTKTEDGFNVKIPFSLKDNFKAKFSAAKWNSIDKCWKVGIKNGKRLEQWVSLHETLANELKLANDIEFTNHELLVMKTEIKNISDKLLRCENALERLANTNKLINESQLQLTEVKNKLAATEDVARAELHKAQTKLEGIINISEIKSIQSEMSRIRDTGIIKTYMRTQFEEVQNKLYDYRDALKNAGLKSKGIDMLIQVNWNRPDKFSSNYINSITLTDFYTLTKLESE